MSIGFKTRSLVIKIGYYLSIIFIILFSYFNLSTQYSGYFNSDTAVPILQTDDFNLSSDLYYWGQARLGSFTPLLGSILHSLFFISSLTAISIANYIILIALFFLFSSYLKNYLLKISLAVIIFLPAIKFKYILLLGHPYSAQLLFVGLVYFILYKLREIYWKNENVKTIYILVGTGILFSFLSVWMSEYSLVFIAYLFLNFFFFKKKEILALEFKKHIGILFTILFAFSIGILFIIYAKSTAMGDAYGGGPIWMDINELIKIANIYGFTVAKKQFFNSEQPLYSLSLFLILIISVFLFKTIYQKSKDFFMLFLLAIFPAIFLYWVGSNGWPGRFFTPAYLFFWIALLVTIDKMDKKNSYYPLGILMIVLLQSYSIVKFEWITPSEVNRLKIFSTLGDAGIVGDYWSSYNIAAANIDNIMATPHPLSCRNLNLAQQVLKKNNLYLISNNWLESFPKTITIFSVTLIKVENTEQEIAGYYLSRYRLLTP